MIQRASQTPSRLCPRASSGTRTARASRTARPTPRRSPTPRVRQTVSRRAPLASPVDHHRLSPIDDLRSRAPRAPPSPRARRVRSQSFSSRVRARRSHARRAGRAHHGLAPRNKKTLRRHRARLPASRAFTRHVHRTVDTLSIRACTASSPRAVAINVRALFRHFFGLFGLFDGDRSTVGDLTCRMRKQAE